MPGCSGQDDRPPGVCCGQSLARQCGQSPVDAVKCADNRSFCGERLGRAEVCLSAVCRERYIKSKAAAEKTVRCGFALSCSLRYLAGRFRFILRVQSGLSYGCNPVCFRHGAFLRGNLPPIPVGSIPPPGKSYAFPSVSAVSSAPEVSEVSAVSAVSAAEGFSSGSQVP